MHFFYKYNYINKFLKLKQEKIEMDDFERKTEKYCEKCTRFNGLPLQKIKQNISAYSIVSEHSKHFFNFEKKYLHYLAASPPPALKILRAPY